jgi:hypothetical protein
MKKHYKRTMEYRYKRYSMDFPTRFNEKIEPCVHKTFDIIFASKETPEQEIINITLMRNKHTK